MNKDQNKDKTNNLKTENHQKSLPYISPIIQKTQHNIRTVYSNKKQQATAYKTAVYPLTMSPHVVRGGHNAPVGCRARL